MQANEVYLSTHCSYHPLLYISSIFMNKKGKKILKISYDPIKSGCHHYWIMHDILPLLAWYLKFNSLVRISSTQHSLPILRPVANISAELMFNQLRGTKIIFQFIWWYFLTKSMHLQINVSIWKKYYSTVEVWSCLLRSSIFWLLCDLQFKTSALINGEVKRVM